MPFMAPSHCLFVKYCVSDFRQHVGLGGLLLTRDSSVMNPFHLVLWLMRTLRSIQSGQVCTAAVPSMLSLCCSYRCLRGNVGLLYLSPHLWGSYLWEVRCHHRWGEWHAWPGLWTHSQVSRFCLRDLSCWSGWPHSRVCWECRHKAQCLTCQVRLTVAALLLTSWEMGVIFRWV